jgi:hypothetical protein
MSEVEQEQTEQVAVSEQPVVESQEENQEQKMVPLAALQAERKKRQELEAKNQVYQDLMRTKEQAPVAPQEEEDPNALVEKHVLKETTAHTKREILETLYQDMNPEAVQKINTYLGPILEKKPWLAASVDTAQNRYARAYEIVQDYLHLVEEKPKVKQSSNVDGQRIVQNAQKPRSPTEVGKSARPEGMEYLKSVQGKKEFREYRQKVLRGEA